jgi:tetratricopeptide (TPR) repeat protein
VGLLLALLWIADPDHATRWVLGDGLLGRVAPLQVLALVSSVQLFWLLVSSSEGDDLARLLRIPFGRASHATGEEALRVETANAQAWALAVSGKPDKAREAVPIARGLYQDYPSYPWIAGTYGTALVAAGQVELGIRLLQGAYDDNLDDALRAHNAAWLAIAEAARGRMDRAAHWRAEAERLDPGCESLGLLDREPPPTE